MEPEKLPDLTGKATATILTGAKGMGFQVDGFFAISGFLLSFPLIEQAIRNEKGRHEYSDSPVVGVVLYSIFRRLFRMWIPLTVAIILAIAVGEYNMDSLWSVLRLYSFPTTGMDTVPFAFGLLWSCRVDIIGGAILVLLVSQIRLCHTFYGAVAVLAASLAPKVVNFLTALPSAPEWSYIVKARAEEVSERYVPVFVSRNKHEWLETHFPGTIPSGTDIYEAGPRTWALMYNEYLVYYMRWTPVFAGLVLAVAVCNARKQEKAQPRARYSFYQARHAFYLTISCIMITLPWVMAILKSLVIEGAGSEALTHLDVLRRTTPSGAFDAIPVGADFAFSVLARPAFSCALCYLVYRCVVPTDHVLYLESLDRALSGIAALGKYSFGVYLFHNRLQLSLLLGVLTPDLLLRYTGSDHVLVHFLVIVSATYVGALSMSIVYHHLVELPLAPFSRHLVAHMKALLVGNTASLAKKVD